MQHFSENYWKKRLAKTVFLGEKGKWPENGRNGEKGKRNRMPGKGKRQSPRSEIGAQVMSFVQFEVAKKRRLRDHDAVAVLVECQKTLIHIFSLMNALAMSSLSNCIGQLYGRCSASGSQNFITWKTVPLLVERFDIEPFSDFSAQ